MGKHSARAPVLMEDFEPFFLKNGLLWVPYISNGKAYLHKVPPPIALKGAGYVARLLGDAKNIVPYTLEAIDRRNLWGKKSA